jgi:Ca2+-binding RTX toxin-like protein
MSRKRKSASPFSYASCEPRNLLASISLNGAELIIGGGTTNDTSTVSISGNEVTATLTGVDSMSFPVADVDSIRFIGLGGDDRFTNNTSIPSFAFGQAGNDTLIGGGGDDRLVGGPGDDVLTGNDGDDEIRGGADGTKEIDGGAGDDRLFGGTGENTIRGGDGDDLIHGGDLADTVFGGDGNDRIYPGHGENVVEGGDGDDDITAGRDDDIVFGGNGDDMIFPGLGDDTVDGDAGDDWIGANDGDDVIRGGDGADRLRGGGGNDRIEGGTGESTGKFAVQNLRGGEGDDVIIGGDDPDVANGDGGDDEFDLGDGDDVALGGEGDDTILLGDGADYAFGAEGDDVIEGGNGNDDLIGGPGNDHLIGQAGFDSATHFFNQDRYRIFGNDLRVRDMPVEGETEDDGTDDVDSIERLRFPNGKFIEAESQIEEFATIQPIIVSNNNGSNTAEFFGTSAQESDIKNLINDIWYQARIQINWAAPTAWNNTFANVGSGGDRPFEDAFRIFDDGAAAGKTSNNLLNINMFFIEIAPGGGDFGENTTNGVALDGENGVAFQVGDELPTFDGGRRAVARVAAHEIAHNFGLEHIPTVGNLMNFPMVSGSNLTASQSATLIASRFSR